MTSRGWGTKPKWSKCSMAAWLAHDDKWCQSKNIGQGTGDSKTNKATDGGLAWKTRLHDAKVLSLSKSQIPTCTYIIRLYSLILPNMFTTLIASIFSGLHWSNWGNAQVEERRTEPGECFSDETGNTVWFYRLGTERDHSTQDSTYGIQVISRMLACCVWLPLSFGRSSDLIMRRRVR